MDAKKREIRTVPCELAIREQAPDAEGESRTIVGTAIVFNSESELLDDWGIRFREVIKPEACTMEFLNSQDIKMNMLHDRALTIARCNKGKGSMQLTVTERGVEFSFDAPKCDIGERCLEMVRRGDYSGCSFEFYPEDYDIEEREGGKDIKVTHKKFRALTALTIGLDPAYTATSVNARELQESTDTFKARKAQEEEVQKQREAEEQEKISLQMKQRAEHLRKLAQFERQISENY